MAPTSDNEVNREPYNRLDLDLYRRLLPLIQERDQKSGSFGFVVHWDEMTWDDFVWDDYGVSPIIQELFWVVETSAGEDLVALESIAALVDPFRCPARALPLLAASLGYRLAESLTEEQQRAAVLGLVQALKSRGTRVSFNVFVRLLGMELHHIDPLWKKHVFEANEDYSKLRYATVTVTGATVGPAATTSFSLRLADAPIKPGTVRITDGSVVVRDDEEGRLIGPTTETGTIDYTTGDLVLTLAAPAAGPVTVTLERVVEEWPYHAARIDLGVTINPGGSDPPIVDEEFVGSLFQRIEEVRPVHVLIRLFGIVIEVKDDFAPAADDRVACVTEVRDDRAAERFRFLLDGASPGEDDLRITHASGGVDTVVEDQDDVVDALCPNDVLVIKQTGQPDQYW